MASSAIASATAATAFQVNGLAEALTVGTILENESAAPELMQVNSILGPNSINVTRNYDGTGIGSLAVGGNLFVRWPAAEEGHEHSGAHTARLGQRTGNTVGYFSIEIAATNTQRAINQLGGDSYENNRVGHRRRKVQRLRVVLYNRYRQPLVSLVRTLLPGTPANTGSPMGLRLASPAV